MTTLTKEQKKARHRLPLFQGILPINWHYIPTEIMAGLTLAALGIPEVMGYTKIAGTPVITGLYTLLLPVLVFAILGSSRHLVVGADSATSGNYGRWSCRTRCTGYATIRSTRGSAGDYSRDIFDPRASRLAGLSREFPSEIRPDRVSDRCWHPGCSGTGGRHAWRAATAVGRSRNSQACFDRYHKLVFRRSLFHWWYCLLSSPLPGSTT